MKTFKEFTELNEVLKQTPTDQLISNSHGSHAKTSNPDQGKGYIVNSHGSHAKGTRIKTKVVTSEGTEEAPGNWEDYLKKNHNPSLGSTLKEHIKSLNDQHELKPSSIKPTQEYTNSSLELSNHLIDKHIKGEEPDAKVGYHNTKSVDNAFNQHKLNQVTILHSGINFHPEHLKSNKMVTHISTSTNPIIADSFSNDDLDNLNKDGNPVRRILRIHAPKGHPVGVIGKAKDPKGNYVSGLNGEDEVVIPRTDSQGKHKTEMKFGDKEVYKDKNGDIIHVYPTHLIHNKEA